MSNRKFENIPPGKELGGGMEPGGTGGGPPGGGPMAPGGGILPGGNGGRAVKRFVVSTGQDNAGLRTE